MSEAPKELMEQIAEALCLIKHGNDRWVSDYYKEAKAIASIIDSQVKAGRAKLIQEIESSFSAAHYHSPEAGRGYVNSIDVVEWVRIKRGGE